MATIDDNLAKAITEALRQAQIDISNQDKLLAGPGDVTLSRPDGSSVTGPSWPKMSSAIGSAVQWRGKPAATENINTYGPTSAYIGQWGFSSSGTLMSNGFPEDGALGILEVFAGGRFSGSQRFISNSGNQYYRTLTAAWNGTNGPWSAWIPTGLPLRGDLSTTDLNTITGENEGIHFQSRNGNATAARNYPVNIAGSLRVYKTAANNTKSCIQYYDAWDRDIAYRRTGVSDASGIVTWSAWSLVGTSAANKALNDLGLGLVAKAGLTSLDWNQFDFSSGQEFSVAANNMTNTPSGVDVTGWSTNNVCFNVIGIDTSVITVECWLSHVNNSLFRRYQVRISGAKGSRVFAVRQIFTSADTIPIANGGTGATKAADARKNLELGSSATRDAYSSSGKLLSEGDFGVGGPALQTSSWRATEGSGFYQGDSYAPTATTYSGVKALIRDGVQFAIVGRASRAFIQTNEGGSAEGWREITTTAVSDLSLKSDVEYGDGSESLANISAMKPVTFRFTRDKAGHPRRGLIAQDLEQIDPQYIRRVNGAINEDGSLREILTLDTNPLLMDALVVLKLLIDKDNQRTSEIEALKSEIEEIRARLLPMPS